MRRFARTSSIAVLAMALVPPALAFGLSDNIIFHDDFEAYAIDERPPYATLIQDARNFAVAQDVEDWFGAGTSNQFFQARKAQQHSIVVRTSEADTQVLTLSFDFITRNLPEDFPFGADFRWVNVQFYSGEEPDTPLNNNFRAHVTSLRLTNATIRTTPEGNPPYGAIDELVRFDLIFNNSNEAVPFFDAAGNQLGTLAAGMSSVWANGVELIAAYNEVRGVNSPVGTTVHGIGFIADSTTTASYDLDNLTIYDIGVVSALGEPPPLLPGDANRDGRVDGEDFLIWQASFGVQEGATWDDGDFNGDGRVDGEDFLIWQAHFGSVVGSSAATPEPAMMSLLALAGAGLFARRRRA